MNTEQLQLTEQANSLLGIETGHYRSIGSVSSEVEAECSRLSAAWLATHNATLCKPHGLPKEVLADNQGTGVINRQMTAKDISNAQAAERMRRYRERKRQVEDKAIEILARTKQEPFSQCAEELRTAVAEHPESNQETEAIHLAALRVQAAIEASRATAKHKADVPQMTDSQAQSIIDSLVNRFSVPTGRPVGKLRKAPSTSRMLRNYEVYMKSGLDKHNKASVYNHIRPLSGCYDVAAHALWHDFTVMGFGTTRIEAMGGEHYDVPSNLYPHKRYDLNHVMYQECYQGDGWARNRSSVELADGRGEYLPTLSCPAVAGRRLKPVNPVQRTIDRHVVIYAQYPHRSADGYPCMTWPRESVVR